MENALEGSTVSKIYLCKNKYLLKNQSSLNTNMTEKNDGEKHDKGLEKSRFAWTNHNILEIGFSQIGFITK